MRENLENRDDESSCPGLNAVGHSDEIVLKKYVSICVLVRNLILNAVTKRGSYLIARMTECMDLLGHALMFSTLHQAGARAVRSKRRLSR